MPYRPIIASSADIVFLLSFRGEYAGGELHEGDEAGGKRISRTELYARLQLGGVGVGGVCGGSWKQDPRVLPKHSTNAIDSNEPVSVQHTIIPGGEQGNSRN